MQYIFIILTLLFSFTIISCTETDESGESNKEIGDASTDTDTDVTSTWTKQLGTSDWESATGIATDSSGNVYVTGRTGSVDIIKGDVGLDGNTSAGGFDLFVVKYNASGTKQWTKQFGSLKNDYAKGIATDSSGNVYVAGSTGGVMEVRICPPKCGLNIFVVKYNSSGTRQWTRQIGTKDKGGSVTGIATDSLENVYVTGYAKGNFDTGFGTDSTSYDSAFLVKYDSSGTKRWTKRLAELSQAQAVATDLSGKVFVTGRTNSNNPKTPTTAIIFLAVFTESLGLDLSGNYYGVLNYTKYIETTGLVSAAGFVVDPSGGEMGNFYLTGTTSKGDIFLIQNYGKYGDWTSQDGTPYSDSANGVATDSSGNFYVAGRREDKNNLDANNIPITSQLLIKYNSSGTKQWTKQYGSLGYDYATGVATDSSGNVYVTGNTSGGMDGNTNAGGYDIFVVKYNSDGVKQ